MKNRVQEVADQLARTHGQEKALAIADNCLVASSNNPTTYFFNEAAFYTDEGGRLQLAKDQKKFAGIREKRVAKNQSFWLQVRNIIKKKGTTT